jgi:hypothetical protein
MNYTQVSSNIAFSSFKGQLNLDDFMKEFENRILNLSRFNRSTDLIVLVGEGKTVSDKFYTKSALTRMKKHELFDLYTLYDLTTRYYIEMSELTKADMIDEIQNVTIETHFKAVLENTDWRDLDCDFTIYGYSQGDVIKVVKVGKVEEYVDSENLTNLYFNSPVEGHFEINEGGEIETISLYELSNFDEYKLNDRDDLIKLVEGDESLSDERKLLLLNHIKLTLGQNFKHD